MDRGMLLRRTGGSSAVWEVVAAVDLVGVEAGPEAEVVGLAAVVEVVPEARVPVVPEAAWVGLWGSK